MLQDEQIIELYFKRDEGALVETSEKYGSYCRSIARTILNDEEIAKECFNDTLRVRSAQTLKRGGGEAVIALDELEECVPDISAYNTDQIEENMVIRKALKNLLTELPVQNRRVFVRRYWYCSSIEEIATAMDLSEANVRTILSRVRSKLKAALEEAGVTV